MPPQDTPRDPRLKPGVQTLAELREQEGVIDSAMRLGFTDTDEASQQAQLRRDQLRDSREGFFGFAQNAVDDIKDFVGGMVGLYTDVAIPSAVDIFSNISWWSKIDPSDITDGVVENSGAMFNAFADSFQKWEDPAKAMYNYPVESLLDLTGFITGIGALGTKGLQSTGTVVRAGSRSGGGRVAQFLGKQAGRSVGPEDIIRGLREADNDIIRREAATLIERGKVAEADDLLLRIKDPGPTNITEREFKILSDHASLDDAVFDLQRMSSEASRFPFGMMADVGGRAAGGLRKMSPAFKAVADFVAVDEPGRFAYQKAADIIATQRTADNLRIKKMYLNEVKNRLTPEEMEVFWLKANPFDDIIDTPWEEVLKTAEGQEAIFARTMMEVQSDLKARFADTLEIKRNLPKERMAQVNHVANTWKEFVKDREAMLVGSRLLNPGRARNASMRFLIREVDDILKQKGRQSLEERLFFEANDELIESLGDLIPQHDVDVPLSLAHPDDVVNLARGSGLESELVDVGRQATVDKFYDFLSQFDMAPDYFPIAAIDRKVGILSGLRDAIFRIEGAKKTKPRELIKAEKGNLLGSELIQKARGKEAVFSIDPADLVTRAGMAATDAKAMVTYLDEMAKSPHARLVKSADEVDLENEFVFSPDYFKRDTVDSAKVLRLMIESKGRLGIENLTADGMVRIQRDIADQVVKIAEDSIDDIANKDIQFYAIPKSMGNNMARVLRPGNPLIRYIWDKPTSLWKSSVLFFSPGWYVANIMGNGALLLAAGTPFGSQIFHPKATRRAFQMIDDSIRPGMNDPLASARSIIAKKQDGTFTSKLSAGYHTTVDWLSQLQDKIEMISAKSAFIGVAKKRVKALQESGDMFARSIKRLDSESAVRFITEKAPDGSLKRPELYREVVDEINDTLFNYHKLHPWERSFIRRAVPFWTWIRNINRVIGSAVKQGFDEPLKGLFVHYLSKSAMDSVNDSDFPRWMNTKMLMGTSEDGEMVFFDLRRYNPFLDILPVTPQDFMKSSNPFIKVAMERVSGRNVWTGKPFKPKFGERMFAYNGKMYRFDGKKGAWTEDPFLPSLSTHLAKNIGPLVHIDRLMNPYVQTDAGFLASPDPILDFDGQPKFPHEDILSIAKFAGLPIDVFSADRINKMKLQKMRWKRRSMQFLKARYKTAAPQERVWLLDAARNIINDANDWLEFDQ